MINDEQEKIHYLERTLKHTKDVLSLLMIIVKNKKELSFNINDYELVQRGLIHDVDKITKSYIEDIHQWFFYKEKLSLEERQRIEKVLKNHKEKQRHHFDFHIINNEGFSNEDLCEMICDWISSIRKDDFSIKHTLQEWKENLNISIKQNPILDKYKDKMLEIFALICSKKDY